MASSRRAYHHDLILIPFTILILFTSSSLSFSTARRLLPQTSTTLKLPVNDTQNNTTTDGVSSLTIGFGDCQDGGCSVGVSGSGGGLGISIPIPLPRITIPGISIAPGITIPGINIGGWSGGGGGGGGGGFGCGGGGGNCNQPPAAPCNNCNQPPAPPSPPQVYVPPTPTLPPPSPPSPPLFYPPPIPTLPPPPVPALPPPVPTLPPPVPTLPPPVPTLPPPVPTLPPPVPTLPPPVTPTLPPPLPCPNCVPNCPFCNPAAPSQPPPPPSPCPYCATPQQPCGPPPPPCENGCDREELQVQLINGTSTNHTAASSSTNSSSSRGTDHPEYVHLDLKRLVNVPVSPMMGGGGQRLHTTKPPKSSEPNGIPLHTVVEEGPSISRHINGVLLPLKSSEPVMMKKTAMEDQKLKPPKSSSDTNDEVLSPVKSSEPVMMMMKKTAMEDQITDQQRYAVKSPMSSEAIGVPVKSREPVMMMKKKAVVMDQITEQQRRYAVKSPESSEANGVPPVKSSEPVMMMKKKAVVMDQKQMMMMGRVVRGVNPVQKMVNPKSSVVDTDIVSKNQKGSWMMMATASPPPAPK